MNPITGITSSGPGTRMIGSAGNTAAKVVNIQIVSSDEVVPGLVK